MTELKIGVLLPRSSLYTKMGIDVFAGLKAGLKHCGIDSARFTSENIGFGGDEKDIYARAEKMLMEQDPHLVVAFIEEPMAALIQPLFDGYNKLLLVINPGANLPDPSLVSPLRFSITLQSALASRLTGRMAVENGSKNNFFATSFYEGGYLNCYSFVRGLDVAGGQVLYNDVVPYKLEDYSAEGIKQAIGASRPDSVLAQFSVEAGDVFLKAYAGAGLRTPVYASSFMLEEEWLSKLPCGQGSIKGIAPWCTVLDSEENKTFLERIKTASGRGATVFHLLGWEAALFCEIFFKEYASRGEDINAVAAALGQAVIASPRGKLSSHPGSNYFFGQMYEAEVVKDEGSGNCKVDIRKEVPLREEDINDFINDPPQGIVSRWLNTYLCI